jgi:hypothetical protein
MFYNLVICDLLERLKVELECQIEMLLCKIYVQNLRIV